MTPLRSWADIDVDSVVRHEGISRIKFMISICRRVYDEVIMVYISLSIPIVARKKRKA